MKNIILLYAASFLLVACASINTATVSDDRGSQIEVTIINKTFFDVEIIDDKRIIPKNSEKSILLPRHSDELNDGYRINYRVQLLGDISITMPRSENIIIKNDQTAAVIESPDFTSKTSYLIVRNDSNQTIRLKKDTAIPEYFNPRIKLEPEKELGSPDIGPNKQSLYDEIKHGNNDFLIEADQYKTIPFSLNNVAPGFIYEYTFDGKQVSLTDERPLVCVGEPTWSRNLEGAGLPVFAEYADRSIKAAIPVNNGVDFITLGAMGEEINKKTVKEHGGNVVLSAILKTDESSYLVTGYDTRSSRQFLVKQTFDDKIRGSSMAFPTRMEGYKLNTVVSKEGNSYLVVGTVDDSAYMREIEDRGESRISVWELWAGDINKNWKTAQTAAYNTKNNTYIISGRYDDIHPVSGKQNAYIGFVDGTTGKIKNDIILKDSIINQVLCDSIGDVYVAGQESRDGIWYAVIQKYNSDGKKYPWQQAKEVEKNSLYRCAVLDEENGQIVLGGAMNADRNGNKGTPFLQGVDIANGNELWIEAISPVSKELNLVTGLQRAKGYGFIAALYGTNGKNNLFILSRLNATGKIINHESY
ncbi:hypothetical protein FACS1894137_07990 [Spirochaetia bacterium]|nr:hypothetical protein FACS1894137_07990 [Spirochaetia bacterium]